jgi:predicted ATPase
MRQLPNGTVTFLFTDVEGSTRLLHELGTDEYAEVLAEHRRVLRDAFGGYGGVEVDTQGDAFFVAFPTAPAALDAATAAQGELSIPVRMGLHTGTPLLTDEGYVGADVHRAARIAAAGHGGQVLVSATTAALVGEALRDLGEHRLKDLSAPERIFQLGDAEFPALKTLYRTNLPVPATPFLGRERELGEVVELLERQDVRLLTLTGPGGTGKTRLALQAAGAAAELYPDGVFWVPLAPLSDPALILEQASQAVGAQGELAEYVRDKRLLLLLDNFEHLIEAANGLAELEAACPNLGLLVTSRELLALPGEHAYPVPPLEPDEGTELFVTRARAAEPDFQPDDAVTELCARLDNLPLALELAAARVRILSPAQLLDRLSGRLDLLKAGRGVDPRQQTLRATIEWSYDLLDEDERRLFARLAVFRGGCTIEAGEEICEVDLDTLQSLVDKSLVRHTGERFWMLETIREYATEQLDEPEIAQRHARHYLEVAEEAYPRLTIRPKPWLDRLEAEHDNIRAAFDYLEEAGDTQGVLQLAGALHRFWYVRGHLREGRERVERALAIDERATAARSRALDGAAVMASNHADYATGRLRAEEALALHRELDEPWGVAYSEMLLGQVAIDGEDDYETARLLITRAEARFRELGDDYYARLAAHNLAYALQNLRELDAARTLLEDVRRGAGAAGDERNEAAALGQLGTIAILQERWDDAHGLLVESLSISEALGDVTMVARDLRRMARVLVETGRAEAATIVLSASEVLREEAGQQESWIPATNERVIERIRETLADFAFEAAWSEGRTLSLDEALQLACAD